MFRENSKFPERTTWKDLINVQEASKGLYFLIPFLHISAISDSKIVSYEIVASNKSIFHFPAHLEDGGISSSATLGLPPEILLHIGLFLNPKDLSRAQRVSKSWFYSFADDSMWHPHLPSSHFRLHEQLPEKVKVVHQLLLKEYWQKGNVCLKEMRTVCDTHYSFSGVVSPNGSWVVTFGMRGDLCLWKYVGSEIAVGTMIGGPLTNQNPHHSFPIYGAFVSLDCRSLFTVSGQGYVTRWTGLETNEITATVLTEADGKMFTNDRIVGGVRSEDGQWALTFGGRGVVILWEDLDKEFPKGRLLTREDPEGNPHEYGTVKGAAISPDGSWALTVGHGDPIVVWRGFLSGSIHATVLKDHPHGMTYVNDCVISRNGLWALTVGQRGRIVKWNCESELFTTVLLAGDSEMVHVDNPHQSEAIKSIKLSPCGTWALSVSLRFVVLWTNLEAPMPTWKILSKEEGVSDLIISSDGSWVALILHGKLQTLYCPPIELISEIKYKEKA